MTDYPAKLEAHMRASGYTLASYARRVLMRNPSTLYRWIAGTSPIPREVQDWLDRKHPSAPKVTP